RPAPLRTSLSSAPWAAARFLGLILLFVTGTTFVSACDSGGEGPAPSDLEGTYVFDRFEFAVSGVDNFDLLADTLVEAENSPRMEFFGGNATANLVYRVEGSGGSSFIAGRFSTGQDRVTIDFSEASEDDRFQLLMPSVVRFQVEDDRATLVAEQPVDDVNLRKYAPERYGGLTQNVDGTLRMRLERQ
ncbi:MAG: hypothetical protein ACLFTE_01880, partial [Salinivenus sp.]